MPEVRLIDANALLNDLKESAKAAREWREGTQDEEIKIRAESAHGTFVECALRVKNAPTIEPEVRHGRWIRNATSDGYHCSNCGHHADGPIGEMIDPRDYECYLDKYCGGCGAKMYADGGMISKERLAEIMAEIMI